MKHHSKTEIGDKLRQAQQLLARGQSQAQACKEIGVSVMTYHRWRKLYIANDANLAGTGTDALSVRRPFGAPAKQIDEMRTENEQLRRLVADLLLEKLRTEERIATIFRDRSVQRN